jgi:hypothetical protein
MIAFVQGISHFPLLCGPSGDPRRVRQDDGSFGSCRGSDTEERMRLVLLVINQELSQPIDLPATAHLRCEAGVCPQQLRVKRR